MSFSETLGTALGWALAPLTAAVSRTRRARMFHPDGQVLLASVEPLARDGALAVVAARLAGPALVRVSSAWWRGGKEWTDALGVAVRFRTTEVASAVAEPGDQDLLFATIRSPWTTLLAPFSTEVRDFLANDYYAVSPFAFKGVAGRHTLRLVAEAEGGEGATEADAGGAEAARDVHEGGSVHRAPSGAAGSRDQRLARAVADGRAVLRLEARPTSGEWAALARIRLRAAVPVDQAALRFSPFRDGRGITPRGFVHALRHGTYAGSQMARPRPASESAAAS